MSQPDILLVKKMRATEKNIGAQRFPDNPLAEERYERAKKALGFRIEGSSKGTTPSKIDTMTMRVVAAENAPEDKPPMIFTSDGIRVVFQDQFSPEVLKDLDLAMLLFEFHRSDQQKCGVYYVNSNRETAITTLVELADEISEQADKMHQLVDAEAKKGLSALEKLRDEVEILLKNSMEKRWNSYDAIDLERLALNKIRESMLVKINNYMLEYEVRSTLRRENRPLWNPEAPLVRNRPEIQ